MTDQTNKIVPGMIETHVIVVEDDIYLMLNLYHEDSQPVTLIMDCEQAQSLSKVINEYLNEADRYYED